MSHTSTDGGEPTIGCDYWNVSMWQVWTQIKSFSSSLSTIIYYCIIITKSTHGVKIQNNQIWIEWNYRRKHSVKVMFLKDMYNKYNWRNFTERWWTGGCCRCKFCHKTVYTTSYMRVRFSRQHLSSEYLHASINSGQFLQHLAHHKVYIRQWLYLDAVYCMAGLCRCPNISCEWYLSNSVVPIVRLQLLSVWCVVFVTIENYIRICHPTKVNILCTSKVALCSVIIGLSLATLMYNFPLWTATIRELRGKNYCLTKKRFRNIEHALTYLDTVFTSHCTFSGHSIVHGNDYCKFYGSRRRQNRLQTQRHSVVSDIRRTESPHPKVTKLLSVVTIVFLILHTPSHVIRLKVILQISREEETKQQTQTGFCSNCSWFCTIWTFLLTSSFTCRVARTLERFSTRRSVPDGHRGETARTQSITQTIMMQKPETSSETKMPTSMQPDNHLTKKCVTSWEFMVCLKGKWIWKRMKIS